MEEIKGIMWAVRLPAPDWFTEDQNETLGFPSEAASNVQPDSPRIAPILVPN